MREVVAAHFSNAAPQAPARNITPPPIFDTYNSHRKRRPKLGDKKVYRPTRRLTLSRIDEAPRPASVQQSTDLASTRPILRSRSNVSADTSRSVPVCNQSHEVGNQLESTSPHYAEPRDRESESSYEDRPVSMTDLPIMVPVDPTTGAYIPFPEYTYYRDDDCRLKKLKKKLKVSNKNNLYLAFMY